MIAAKSRISGGHERVTRKEKGQNDRDGWIIPDIQCSA